MLDFMELSQLFFVLFLSYPLYYLPRYKFRQLLLAGLPLIGIILTPFEPGNTVAIALLSLLEFSHLRLLKGRYGERRERHVLLRSWYLITIAALLVTAARLEGLPGYIKDLPIYLAAALAIRAAVLSLYRLRLYSYKDSDGLSRKTLPPVTVAIPARNETHALNDALRSLIANDYPKMEIIVLDDCSQDSTPQIIKTFAHDGVRFIQGRQPDSGWIGKNNALSQLLAEASGDYIIFLGADINFGPRTVSRMVAKIRQNQLKMLAVMPRRRQFDLLPAAFNTVRYYAELSLMPWPMSNSCWAADTAWLRSTRAFERFRHNILPERAIAKAAKASGDYHFIISQGDLGVTTRKKLSSIIETATRTFYPRLNKEPVLAAAGIYYCLLNAYLLSRVIFLPTNLFVYFGSLALWLSHLAVSYAFDGIKMPLATVFAPLNWLASAYSLAVSMVKYEFGEINWKGRNVCIPQIYRDRVRLSADVRALATSRSPDKK